MRGFEKFQAAVFDEGNVAPRQLQLERVAVMRASEQHRLAFERHAAFARLENARDDVFGLRLVVGDSHVVRRDGRRLLVVRSTLRYCRVPFGHQRVRRIEHALRRTVVVFERDDRRRRGRSPARTDPESRGCCRPCRPKRIDRLRIVADDGDAVAVPAEALQDLRLQHVRVLILVDEDVIELAADLGREPLVAHHRVPVEQQVVVVERLVRELLLDIRAIELRELRLPFGAPGKQRVERLGERPLRVDAMRIDGEARVFARKALLGFREAELVAQHVHQVGGVAAVEHAEARVEADGCGVPANQPIGDRVERAGPGQAESGPGSGTGVPVPTPDRFRTCGTGPNPEPEPGTRNPRCAACGGSFRARRGA